MLPKNAKTAKIAKIEPISIFFFIPKIYKVVVFN